MNDNVFLIMDRKGVRSLRKTKPQLNSGEVAVRLSIEISDKFFERFIPEADLTIPDELVIEPEISVNVERQEDSDGSDPGVCED